jgi:hypothetical protein
MYLYALALAGLVGDRLFVHVKYVSTTAASFSCLEVLRPSLAFGVGLASAAWSYKMF